MQSLKRVLRGQRRFYFVESVIDFQIDFKHAAEPLFSFANIAGTIPCFYFQIDTGKTHLNCFFFFARRDDP